MIKKQESVLDSLQYDMEAQSSCTGNSGDLVCENWVGNKITESSVWAAGEVDAGEGVKQ
jgi:hypothetical protein